MPSFAKKITKGFRVIKRTQKIQKGRIRKNADRITDLFFAIVRYKFTFDSKKTKGNDQELRRSQYKSYGNTF